MEQKIVELIAEKLCKKTEQVTMASRLVEDLGADSLDVVETLMAVEAKYGFELDNDEAIGLKTVGEVVKLIESKLN